jgi:hypothetical protein
MGILTKQSRGGEECGVDAALTAGPKVVTEGRARTAGASEKLRALERGGVESRR